MKLYDSQMTARCLPSFSIPDNSSNTGCSCGETLFGQVQSQNTHCIWYSKTPKFLFIYFFFEKKKSTDVNNCPHNIIYPCLANNMHIIDFTHGPFAVWGWRRKREGFVRIKEEEGGVWGWQRTYTLQSERCTGTIVTDITNGLFYYTYWLLQTACWVN